MTFDEWSSSPEGLKAGWIDGLSGKTFSCGLYARAAFKAGGQQATAASADPDHGIIKWSPTD